MLAALKNIGSMNRRDSALNLQDFSIFFKACGEKLRLEILRILQADSFGVSELCFLFDLRQSAISHHLKVLSEANLIAARREGNFIFYRRNLLADGCQLSSFIQTFFCAIDSLPISESLSLKMRKLQQQRVNNSQLFFQNNSNRFAEQQDLIAGYSNYGKMVAGVLERAVKPSNSLALEIGPGDGAFLLELSPNFDRVIALDNSEAMLNKASQLIFDKKVGNVEFILGDTTSKKLQGLEADAAVINMVLHHTPDPKQMIADTSALLAPGGALVITELCSHSQAWARKFCGDLWLGFEPDQVNSWCQVAGLKEVANSHIAQRNGFQIQVRLYKR